MNISQMVEALSSGQPKRKTQLQIFYEEQRKIAEVDQLFLELVKDGMTKQELRTNIRRRPIVWRRFEHWAKNLPDSFKVWEEANYTELEIAAAETGQDREMGFDWDKYVEKAYDKYLETFKLT